ncbi:MAG: thioesterase family protein [Anaerolineae bacterium]
MDSIIPPEGFRHHYPLQVRWSDMDALGHVNNARFLTYFEQARINYVRGLRLWDGVPDKLGLIIARVEIDFKLPLFAGDDVHVFTRCARLGNRSLDTEQVVARRKDDQLEVVARGVITIVVYDYNASQSAPIPAEWRDLVKAYEVTPLNE